MKRLLLATSLTLAAAGHAAAADRSSATEAELAPLFASTTYVVVTNDNIILDAQLQDAAKRLWTLTPHKIISKDEFKELRKDANSSFLMITTIVENGDRRRQRYFYLNLLMGSEKAAENLNALPEVVAIPMACEERSGEIPTTMLDPMLLFAQKHAENRKDKAFEGRLLASFQQPLQAYNYDMAQLKGKTIYVDPADVDPKVKVADMEKREGNPFRFVGPDELARVVSEQVADAVVAFTIYPHGGDKDGFGYKMLMGTDGALYYYYYELKRKNFLFQKNDFEKISRSLK
ncbi:MAG: hypothetical protein LBS63_00255 [Prevotellaceae bacterium]|jgi:hypothetical protein|nr:hypothetical protein [Prevotellaceae bacterium]